MLDFGDPFRLEHHQILLDDLIEHYNIKDYFIEILGINNYFAHSKVKKGILWMKKMGLN